MAVMAKWNDHKFEVSPSVIRSFTALSFKGASETEENTGSGQKYVSRKNGKPLEISLTAVLDRRLGSDVRKEAMAWTEEARAGKKGYFYVHEENSDYKLVPSEMMLVEAAVSEVEVSPTGLWVRANVQLTLRQCGGAGTSNSGSGSSSGGGSSGGSGGGSSSGGSSSGYTKKSVWSMTPNISTRGPTVMALVSPYRTERTRATVSDANNSISAIVSKARENTLAKKQQTTSAKSKELVSTAKNLFY